MNIFWCIVGIMIGWIIAHNEISTECQRQGNFYVGKTLYSCEIKK